MVYTFACTVGCFIDDDWNLIERVVDFKPLEDKEHEGIFGGFAFVNGVQERGGLDKISLTFQRLTFDLTFSISTSSVSPLTMPPSMTLLSRQLLGVFLLGMASLSHLTCISDALPML